MKHFVFDFDGTLVDTDGLFNACLRHALEPFSVDAGSGSDFMEKIRHKHPYRIFEDLLEPHQAEEALKRLQDVGKKLSLDIKSFQGIEESLDKIKSRGVGLCIWTGRDGGSTERILSNLKLNHYFDKIVSGTCVETNKPGQDGLHMVADFLKAKPEELIMVGDHHHDIEPANQFGSFSVHAKWKKKPHSLPNGVLPNIEFEKVDEFNLWLSQI